MPGRSSAFPRKRLAQNHNLFTSVQYGDVTLEGAYNRSRKRLPTAPYETVINDNRTQAWDEREYEAGMFYVHCAAEGRNWMS